MRILGNLYNQIKNLQKDKESSPSPELFVNKIIYYEVEDLLCFERGIRFCYASLEMMMHNRTIRQQCQTFARWSLTNEEELEMILTESLSSEIKIEKKYPVYTLPPDDFTLESVLGLGLVLAGYRLNVYQELRSQLSVKNRIRLNRIIAHVMEEIKFFKREKEILAVEGIMYSLN
jgi:hypothetical protein